MTAGVFGRVPRVALLVVVVAARHGDVDVRRDVDRPARGPARAHGSRRAADARRARRPPPGLRLREGHARAGRASRGASRAQSRAMPPTSSSRRLPLRAPRSSDVGAPIVVLRLASNSSLRAGGLARERRAVRRHARASRRRQADDGAGEAEARRAQAEGRAASRPRRPKAAVKRDAQEDHEAAHAPHARLRGEGRAEGAAATRSRSPPARSASPPGSSRTRSRTPANVDHWLYQHNWIVTGATLRLVGRRGGARDARRGRHPGAEALGRRRAQRDTSPRKALAKVEAASR